MRRAAFLALAVLLAAGCTQSGASRDTQIYLDMMKSSDVEKVRSAVRSLALRRSKHDMEIVIPALVEMLSHPDSEVRFYAIDALRQVTGDEAFPTKPEEARQYFRKHRDTLTAGDTLTPAQKMRSAQAEIKNAHGIQAMLVGENLSAQQFFAEALALEFNNPAYHNNLGLAYFNDGRYESALDKFEAAVGFDPAFAPGIMNKGRAYEKLAETARRSDFKSDEEYNAKVDGYLASAEKELKRTLEFDSRGTNWAARHVLARVLFKQRRFTEAIETMEKAVEIMPDAPELRVTMAIIYYGADMPYKAWKELFTIRRLGAEPNPDFVAKVKDALKQSGQSQYLDMTIMDPEQR